MKKNSNFLFNVLAMVCVLFLVMGDARAGEKTEQRSTEKRSTEKTEKRTEVSVSSVLNGLFGWVYYVIETTNGQGGNGTGSDGSNSGGGDDQDGGN